MLHLRLCCFKVRPIDKIRSFDIDESCLEIADTINPICPKKTGNPKAVTQNIMDIDYAHILGKLGAKLITE